MDTVRTGVYSLPLSFPSPYRPIIIIDFCIVGTCQRLYLVAPEFTRVIIAFTIETTKQIPVHSAYRSICATLGICPRTRNVAMLPVFISTVPAVRPIPKPVSALAFMKLKICSIGRVHIMTISFLQTAFMLPHLCVSVHPLSQTKHPFYRCVTITR